MKKIGIIGGLGPLATVDFFEKIVLNTPASKDQDHPKVLIYNNPQIPDRTQAIFHAGQSPVSEIVSTGKVLEKMGADFLCLPCNTSYYFYDQIQNELEIPLLNMIDITVNSIKESGAKKVCVLGTEGTIRSGIYKKKLIDNNIELTNLDENMIALLQFVIYEVVKKQDFSQGINEFVQALDQIKEIEKVDLFILACTELPILFEKYQLKYKTLDPTLALAKEAIRLTMGE